MTDFLQFQSVPDLAPQMLVDAARAFLGVAYSHRKTWMWQDESGAWHGHVDCVRLPLRVAQQVGLLPLELDLSLRRPRGVNLTREEMLWQLLGNNFTQVEIAARQPGDLLLMNWRDVPDWKDEVHHVAFYTSHEPAPYGSLLEALDRDAGGNGMVTETRIDALTFGSRIDSAWRLNQFV